jgi:hypothetical protein
MYFVIQSKIEHTEFTGASISIDHKAGGIGGNGVFLITLNQGLAAIHLETVEIPRRELTVENFNKYLTGLLRGDNYLKNTPKGVEMTIAPGAAMLMAKNGVIIEKGGILSMSKNRSQAFALAGNDNENKKINWMVIGGELVIRMEEKTGGIFEYSIANGVFDYAHEKQIK